MAQKEESDSEGWLVPQNCFLCPAHGQVLALVLVADQSCHRPVPLHECAVDPALLRPPQAVPQLSGYQQQSSQYQKSHIR